MRKNKAGGITGLNFKPYYIAALIKTVRHRHKHTHHTHTQTDGMVHRTKMNPHSCGELTDDIGGNNTQWGKTVCSISGVGKTRKLHADESNQTTLSYHTQP